MTKLPALLLLFICSSFGSWATASYSLIINDTSLKEVVVNSFNMDLRWKDVPAAVALIPAKSIQTFNPSSLVPILNSTPGVRMEERSPGSYRVSIRGSLLRSPFGVRNSKIYWNDIPLTDATGNTYFNLLDIQQFNNIEIAKGPVASCYGAGTGGAILLNQPLNFADSPLHSFSTSLLTGSFGLQQQKASWMYQQQNFASSIQLNHIQSNGYRQQSSLLKSSIVWQTAAHVNNHVFHTMVFYTDLMYETPGGITLAQVNTSPTLARVPTGTMPGAIQQKTAVFNKTFWSALKHTYTFNTKLLSKSFLSISNTKFNNPFITNYEQRNEININSGSQFLYKPINHFPKLQWINGVEWLINESVITNNNNAAGIPSSLIAKDIVYSFQGFAYTQLKLPLNQHLMLVFGGSINHQSYRYKRLSDLQPVFYTKSIAAPFIPRVSMSYDINQQITAYAIISKGFSSPSLAEVRPSDGNYYPSLNAEHGLNIETGIKGFLFNKKLTIDIAAYQFKLKDAIVKRTDQAGVEYFVNAGSTNQSGIEAFCQYQFLQKNIGVIKGLQLANSFSYQPYIFTNYQQDNNIFSGNHLTGVPQTINITSFQLMLNKGWQFNASCNATSMIPLNDANTVYANAYQLLQAKLSKQLLIKQNVLQLFIGGDNLLNQSYSLGNDINAAGNRYYNPAPERNWYAGFKFDFH